MRKKYVIGGIFVSIILVAGILYHFWPWKEYTGLSMRPDYDVAGNIMAAPGNQIFAQAIYNMGYTTFLQGEGPFTVFVPTDEAYRKYLTPATKQYLGDTENSGAIRQVALYHVVKGYYPASKLTNGLKLTTIEGEDLEFNVNNGVWLINGYAYIVNPDIISKNGIIHVVNGYLIPPSLRGIQ